jgi:DNA invertase Pin-like site-specific DNA recombinase
MKTQVIALTRRSRGEQQSHFSHEAQIKHIEEYCKTNTLIPMLFFREDDKGYKNEMERPVLAEVLSLMKRNEDIKGIVIWRADRFARDPRLAYYLAETLARQGKRVYCVEDKAFGINFREAQAIGMTPEEYQESAIMTAFKLVFAEIEWVSHYIRSEAGKDVSVEEGNPPYKPPFGYTRDEEGSVIIDVGDKGDGGNGGTAKAIFGDFLILKNITQVADRYGLPVGTVRGILKNPFYTGRFRWRGGLKKGNYMPLIFVDTFEKVQEILKEGARDNVGKKD